MVTACQCGVRDCGWTRAKRMATAMLHLRFTSCAALSLPILARPQQGCLPAQSSHSCYRPPPTPMHPTCRLSLCCVITPAGAPTCPLLCHHTRGCTRLPSVVPSHPRVHPPALCRAITPAGAPPCPLLCHHTRGCTPLPSVVPSHPRVHPPALCCVITPA